ncbi:Cyclin-dependent kinase inhibitor 1B [Bagarius yarrelli]|uniref:Cyclin-dependent kinase inhibitor 1B n=1 Tax=Bagarius yarrelli TaxID=175774 RepID=A0A556TI10_BAGYA|nr:Cyclin-dependent kinase inhibitor 1B [Bagarius yarrelli]
MASVQLFPNTLAAPRERIPQQTRRNACRNLFGPVNHEELNRDLNAKLSEISERNQQRWNFNFASGTPLQGDYEWEKAALDATPAFYLHFRSGEKKAAALPHTEAPNGVTCARSDAASGAVSSSRTGKRSRTKRKTSARLTTSTTTYITDLYSKRKKAGDVKERKSAAVKPLRFLSSEQTPRKALR